MEDFTLTDVTTRIQSQLSTLMTLLFRAALNGGMSPDTKRQCAHLLMDAAKQIGRLPERE